MTSVCGIKTTNMVTPEISEPRRADILNPGVYDRTDRELQEFALLCMVVAGKHAATQQKKLRQFIEEELPVNYIDLFASLREMNDYEMLGALHRVKMGKYRVLGSGFRRLANLDLRSCSIDDLLAVPGIGPKTARFFLVYTRKGERHAVLDTHVLAELRENGFPDAPRQTPSGKQYDKWEKVWLEYCDALGVDPVEHDWAVWSRRRRP